MTALAGANLIYGLGMLEMGVTFDFGQLVMDNEFAQMIKYCVNGIPVNDQTLSVDVIHEVGQFKDYVTHRQTFDNMRSISHPTLIDRRNRKKWEEAGATDLYQRAKAAAKKILAEHTPEPLPEEIRRALREIVEETEDHHGVGRTTPDY